jgi:hypothetical protein
MCVELAAINMNSADDARKNFLGEATLKTIRRKLPDTKDYKSAKVGVRSSTTLVKIQSGLSYQTFSNVTRGEKKSGDSVCLSKKYLQRRGRVQDMI